MVRRFAQLVMVLLPLLAPAARASEYLLLMEGDDTLARAGHSSYRAMYADAIERLGDAGARAVALKFFFFEPDPVGDAALAAAMADVPTYLQYALRGDPAIDNPLLEGGVPDIEPQPAWLDARSPDMPIDELGLAAAGVGFVDAHPDFDVDLIPLYGRIASYTVPALTTQLLALVFGEPTLENDVADFGGQQIALVSDGRGECEVEELPDEAFVPLDDLLAGDLAAERIAGRVVVIGYDGRDAPTFSTGFFSSRSAHPLFMDRLLCLEGVLAAGRR